MDFTPRYLREDDTGSWLSDNSAAATVEVHSDPGTKLIMIRTMVMLMKMSNTLNFDFDDDIRVQRDGALGLLTRWGDDERRWKQPGYAEAFSFFISRGKKTE